MYSLCFQSTPHIFNLASSEKACSAQLPLATQGSGVLKTFHQCHLTLSIAPNCSQFLFFLFIKKWYIAVTMEADLPPTTPTEDHQIMPNILSTCFSTYHTFPEKFLPKKVKAILLTSSNNYTSETQESKEFSSCRSFICGGVKCSHGPFLFMELLLSSSVFHKWKNISTSDWYFLISQCIALGLKGIFRQRRSVDTTKPSSPTHSQKKKKKGKLTIAIHKTCTLPGVVGSVADCRVRM